MATPPRQQQLEIPARGTRGSRIPWGIVRFVQPLLKAQVTRYRKNAGVTPPTMRGNPLVLLTTVGAKTGNVRTHPLGGFEQDDGSWLVVASKAGAATHPAWFINLCKNPDRVSLEVGSRKFHVRPSLLKGAEYEAAYARIAAVAPGYAGYRKSTDREIPVIRLTPIEA